MINLSLFLRPLITYAAAIVITPQTRAPLLLTILHNSCNNMLFSDAISLSLSLDRSTIWTNSSHVRWMRIANSTCFSWFSPNSVRRRRGGLAGCNCRRLSAVDHDHDDLSFFVLSLFLCESLFVRGFRTKRLSRKQNKTKSPTKRRIGDLRIISLTEEEEFGSRCTATNKQTNNHVYGHGQTCKFMWNRHLWLQQNSHESSSITEWTSYTAYWTLTEVLLFTTWPCDCFSSNLGILLPLQDTQVHVTILLQSATDVLVMLSQTSMFVMNYNKSY
jgi:hypothetical protein